MTDVGRQDVAVGGASSGAAPARADAGGGASGFAAAAYRRGYTTPPDLKSAIAAAHRSRWWLTVLAALADHLTVYILLFGGVWVMLTQPPVLGSVAVPVALVGVGRQLRALECLIHEGSHLNWSRSSRWRNDLLTFLLSGLPTGISVADYRASHLRHHGRFATADDPDRRRYLELDIESVQRDTLRAFVPAVIRRLPRYQLGWLRELRTSPLSLLMQLGWATIVVGLPAWLLFGRSGAALATALWLAGHVVALPVIRFLGESSEHVYTGAETMFDATISNLGRLQRYLVHPHNDGYHTVHHLWPGVPHHALRKLHELLVARDWEGYGRRVRYRSRLLEEPRCDAQRSQVQTRSA